ncbi:Protein phosphatase PP2A regulatory subunit B [Blastocladiella emersonii ATCC 22665]|nr:Protein phosphatase PP2A regulatory subunit B [Blastocladiella emersonii ATCC 22665]
MSAPQDLAAAPVAVPAPAAVAAVPAMPVMVGAPTQAFAPQPAASLYVGELDPSVTEAFLFEMFNVIGPVASVRVCRDAVTRRSLGYAYVNFQNQADGERALEQLNYTNIKGKTCRIMWSQRDPSLRRAGTGNVFIKNLDASIDNKALHDTFVAFGKILSCKVATKDGNSLGYGFVHYETREAAEAAINAVNGMLLNDKEVFVGFHVTRREREAVLAEQRSKFTNLYIKNLPEDMTDEAFHALFAKYGNVLSAAVSRGDDAKSKGFGFVNYATHEEAQAAVDALNNLELEAGKPLYVARAQKKSEREEELRRQYEARRQERVQKFQGNNVYIKNLDDDVEDDKLRTEFAAFGTITSAKVMRDEKGQSRGFGFVCYSTPDEATNAVTEMNGRMLGSKPLYVALAQRKEQRRAQLEAQHAQRAQIPPFRMGQPGAMLPPGAMYPGAPMYFPGAHGPQRGFFGQPGAPMPPQGARPLRWAAPAQPMGAPMGYPMAQYPAGPMGAPMPGAPMPMPPQGPAGPMPQGARPSGRGRGGSHMRGAGQPRMPRGQHPNAGPNQGFKYNSSARNTNGQGPADQSAAPAPVAAPEAAAAPAAAPAAAAPEAAAAVSSLPANLTPAALAAASPEDQKQVLGEALYPLIAAKEPEHAPKITGMLLEMETTEILHLLESPEDLAAKVAEAADLVRAHLAADE